MYTTFYGFNSDPFRKDIPVDELFLSHDLKEFSSRMEYFKQVKGFAVAFGRPGMGKTTCIRYFTAKLNPQLFKVVYLPLSALTVNEFYRNLCIGLGLEPKFKKVDMFHALQDHIVNLAYQKKQTPFIILDEGQLLGAAILNELRMAFNFQMDSKNHAMVLIAAQPSFIQQLNLHNHEPLRQRLMVHHEFKGISDEEIDDFISTRLSHVGFDEPLFTTDALEAMAETTSGSPRMISILAEKSLMLGAQKKLRKLDAKVVQDAYASMQIFES